MVKTSGAFIITENLGQTWFYIHHIIAFNFFLHK
jgi:hypothetical protein